MKSLPEMYTAKRSAVLLATIFYSAFCLAQDYPQRPIRFIVGFVPGGVADLMARSLSQKLSEAWNQQVIVDNRAGAGGVISMQIAAKAVPDGYTLLLGSSTQFSITPALRSDIPYDPLRDYIPVTSAALTPVILTVAPSHPARSVQELIQLAKAKSPQAASFASTGYGAAPHIAGELLKRMANIEMTHVPYKGGGDAVVALMGGQVPTSFGAVSTALPHLRSGKMRALGVTSVKRLAATPDVPTFIEGGLAGFEVVQWFGVFAPQRTPATIVRKLNEALGRALASPEFKEQFAAQGIELQHSTPAQFSTYVSNELVRWKRMLKEMGIKDVPT